MTPTNEQLKILDTAKNLQNGEVAIINALAGCAKTTTLKMIAEENPDSSFLYLAFNRSVKEEASKKFPNNTKVLTMSGFAKRYVNSSNGFNTDILSFITQALKIYNWEKWEIKKLYEEICKSPTPISELIENLDEALALYEEELDSSNVKDKNYWLGLREKHIKMIPKLHQYIINHEKDTLFQSYEKEFIDQYYSYPEHFRLPFDYIVIDEAQDVSELFANFIIAGIQTQNFKIILVGDNNQKIYGWRGDIDLFGVISKNFDVKHLTLTKSFRFKAKSEIEEFANSVLSIRKQNISGGKTSEEFNKRFAYLSRTNLALFETAISLMNEHKTFFFDSSNFTSQGKDVTEIYKIFLHTIDLCSAIQKSDKEDLADYEDFMKTRSLVDKKNFKEAKQIFKQNYFILNHLSENDLIKVLDAYQNFSQKMPKVNKNFKSFSSFVHLEKFAKNRKDIELVGKTIIAISVFIQAPKLHIPRYEPDAVLRFFKTIEAYSTRDADLVLSTFHKSKGLEFESVEIIDGSVMTSEGQCYSNLQISNTKFDGLLGFQTISTSVSDEDELLDTDKNSTYFINEAALKNLDILALDGKDNFIREEYNLLYVAITRAEKTLIVNNGVYQETLEFLKLIKDKEVKELTNYHLCKVKLKDGEIIKRDLVEGLKYKRFFIEKETLEKFFKIVG